MTPYYDQAGITIYHGDCREVMPTLAAGIADAVVSDPPYGTRVERDGYGRRQIHGGNQHIANDDDLSVMSFFMAESVRVLKSNAWAAVFCSPKRHDSAAAACRQAAFEVVGEVVWDKLRPGLGGGIRYQHETILLCAKGKAQGRSAMFSVQRALPDDALLHPHQKPLPLLCSLIGYVSGPEELVIDPSTGSGSTLVAAKLCGRRAIGIEIEERYCEIAANRLSQGVLFGASA